MSPRRALPLAAFGLAAALASSAAPSSLPAIARDASVAATTDAAEGAFELVGQIGGPVTAVAVDGDRAYVGIGARIVVVDIAGWPDYRVLGESDAVANRIHDIAVDGGTVVAATDFGGLQVVDVRDPARPRRVGGIAGVPSFGDAEERRVAVAGGLAYLVSPDDGLRVFDVRDPVAPIETSQVDVPGARAVAVAGGHAWIAAGAYGVRVWDVADPAAPREVGGLRPWWANDIVIEGDRVYTLVWDTGGRVYDSSLPETRATAVMVLSTGAPAGEPPSLLQLGIAWVPGSAFFLAVDRGYGYVVTDGGWLPRGGGSETTGIQAIDFADPTAPRIVAAREMEVGSRHIAALGGRVFVTMHHDGLAMLDAGRRTDADRVGRHLSWPDVWAAGVDSGAPILRWGSGHAWAALGAAGVQGFDVDLGGTVGPRAAGALAPGWFASGFDLAGDDLAVVAAGAGGLRVVDIAYPDRPREVGVLWSSWKAEEVRVDGAQAAVAAGYDGLRIVDIADPTSPRETGAVNVGSGGARREVRGVIPAGVGVWGAVIEGGLRFVDARDPAAPRVIGAIDVPGYIDAIDGTRAGLVLVALRDASGMAFWQVIDARDPARPALAARVPSVEAIKLLDAVDGAGAAGDIPRLYIAGRDPPLGLPDARRVTAWDIADPAAPTLVGEYAIDADDESRVVALAATGERVALLGQRGQVWSVRFEGASRTVATPELSLPGVFASLALAGDGTVVAAHDGGLSMYDVADPSMPMPAGAAAFDLDASAVAAQPRMLRVVGTRAYVAMSDTSIGMFDVSARTAPRLLGRIDVDQAITALDVAGNRAYVGLEVGGLAIFDVEQATAVRRVGTYMPPTATAVMGVTVAGGMAYLAVFDAGLEVVDVRDAAAPSLIGSLDQEIEDWVELSVTEDSRTLVVSPRPSPDGVAWAVDVRDPRSPRLIGDLPEAAGVVWMAPGDSRRLYVADGRGVTVLDIADPAKPRLLARHVVNGVIDMRAAGGRIHALTSGGSLAILPDFDDPATLPAAQVNLPTWTDARALDVEGGNLFVVDRDAGLRVFDLGDPRFPRPMAVYTGTGATDLDVADGRAYLANGSGNALEILDVGEPDAPELLATFALDASPEDVQVEGGRAFVQNYNVRGGAMARRLQVLDVSDASRILSLGGADLPAGTNRMAIDGTRAYAIGRQWLRILDVSNPAAIAERGLWPAPEKAQLAALAVDGTSAFVAHQAGAGHSLHVLDVTAADAPRETASVDHGFLRASDVALTSDHVFIAGTWNATGGIAAVDRRDPAAPAVLGTYRAPWTANRLRTAGDLVIASAPYDGVWILRWRSAGSGRSTVWLPKVEVAR